MRTLNRGRVGFTLVEVLVALVTGVTVMSALALVLLRTQRDFIRQRERRRADEAARAAVTMITSMARPAGANPLGLAFAPLVPDPVTPNVFNSIRVRADFNPPDGDVADIYEDVQFWVSNDTLYARWLATGGTEVAGFPVRELRFDYFDSNGAPLTTPVAVGLATRVRVTVSAPQAAGAPLIQRSGWVHLRNRS